MLEFKLQLLVQDLSLIHFQLECGGIGSRSCGLDCLFGLWLPPGIGYWMIRLVCGLIPS